MPRAPFTIAMLDRALRAAEPRGWTVEVKPDGTIRLLPPEPGKAQGAGKVDDWFRAQGDES